ncbi:hypothetical protein TSAR_015514 [Trichomalopsis sarcophagae]|uniref:Uncharacterized protein n=1 Tax=Trichomalopsis sarcophagae TaxID=543379 RepID=A0A232EZV2_9HYME|nr:hypothetical protein TSAR_015514 [Trichomalopsis sarcophagae]
MLTGGALPACHSVASVGWRYGVDFGSNLASRSRVLAAASAYAANLFLRGCSSIRNLRTRCVVVIGTHPFDLNDNAQDPLRIAALIPTAEICHPRKFLHIEVALKLNCKISYLALYESETNFLRFFGTLGHQPYVKLF